MPGESHPSLRSRVPQVAATVAFSCAPTRIRSHQGITQSEKHGNLRRRIQGNQTQVACFHPTGELGASDEAFRSENHARQTTHRRDH